MSEVKMRGRLCKGPELRESLQAKMKLQPRTKKQRVQSRRKNRGPGPVRQGLEHTGLGVWKAAWWQSHGGWVDFRLTACRY